METVSRSTPLLENVFGVMFLGLGGSSLYQARAFFRVYVAMPL